jgi:adenylate cyclase
MARLIINSPDGRRGILELSKPVLTVGRGTANDLVLNDTSVSRFHCVIKKVEGGNFAIADRGSTNGVVVNGKRIQAETPIVDGDRAKIGVYTLVFEQIKDDSLVVKKPSIAQTVHEVLKSVGPQLSIRPKSESASSSSSPSDMLKEIVRLERENYLLRVLYDAGKALSLKLSVADVAAQAMDFTFRIEGVERGFMMLFDKNGQTSETTEVKYRKPPEPGSDQGSDSGTQNIILSQTIIERVKSEQQPILITDVSDDERFSGSESLKISGLRSAMVAPLIGNQRLLGLVYVDNMQRTAAFTEEELNIFSVIAAQAAASIDVAAAHEQLAEGAIQRSALERFLAPEVVEMVVNNPAGVRLGGVNQQVSVMFADIRGFTTLSERMAPEKIVELLNEYFTRATDVIFDNGGTLDKYIGDAVMAVFGAPISKGNDALNCVKAAVELQRLVVEMNRDARSRKWPQLQVGIGINTGEVTAGNIGSPRRIDYTVIGDNVNMASRLMNKAKGGEIIIAESTAGELGKGFGLTKLEPLTVKGKSEPVSAYAVEWRAAAAETK